MMIILAMSALLTSDALPSLVLTSEPFSSSDMVYCPGQVVFTCNATDISVVVRWKLDNSRIGEYTFDPSVNYPLNLNFTSPVIDSIQVINATVDGNSLDVISNLSVSNISALNGSSLCCEDTLQRKSNPVYVAAIRQGIHIMQLVLYVNSA